MEPRFEINPDLDEQVAGLDSVHAAELEAASKIADHARSMAPVDSGAYVDGIEVQETKRGARVLAGAPESHWVEFGVPSQGKPARFVLRRAVEAAGFKFKKGGG